jgi:hypothetical protein
MIKIYFGRKIMLFFALRSEFFEKQVIYKNSEKQVIYKVFTIKKSFINILPYCHYRGTTQ